MNDTDPTRWPLARALVARLLNQPSIRPLTTPQRVKARDLLSVQYESNTRILAADVSAGQTVDSWYASMREVIGSYARQMATAGAGSIPRAPVREAVDRILTGQRGYLDRFATVLDAGRRVGKMLSEAAIAARSMLYGATGIEAWWRGDEPIRSGVVVYYIALDTKGTCVNCSEAMRLGPYEGGRHPYPGELCLGGSRCRCRLRYEHNPDLAAEIRSKPVPTLRRDRFLVPDIVFPKPDPVKPVAVPVPAPRPPAAKSVLDILDAEFANQVIRDGTEGNYQMRLRIDALVRENSTLTADGVFHGMTTPVSFRGLTVGGTNVYWEDQARANEFVQMIYENKRRGIELPPVLSSATNNVYFTTQANSHDVIWQAKYKNFTESLATGGDGSIVIYNNNFMPLSSYAHESGHNLATKLYVTTTPLPSSKYTAAMRGENPVSEYAKNAPSEDFAEAIREYVTNGSYMKTVAPKRYGVIDKIMKDGRE